MLKLIMADIKVLENRIWQIPLGVTVFSTLLLILIPSEKDKIISFFGFIPLITGGLGLQLMKQLEDNKLHYQISSLPCTKLEIVTQKFVMLFIFLILSITCQLFFSLIAKKMMPDMIIKYSNSEIINFNILVMLRIALFTIPLFFKFRRSVKAFVLFFTWLTLMTVIHVPITLELLYARNSIPATVFDYFFMFAACVLCAVILFFKDKKELKPVFYLLIPVAVIFPISLALLQELLNSLIHRRILYQFFAHTIDDPKRLEWIFGYQLPYLYVHLVPTLILFAIGYYIWIKGDKKCQTIIKNASLILLLPVVFFAMENSIRIAILTVMIIKSADHPNLEFPLFSISQYIIFIPMLIVSIHYSKKFLSEGGK
ncbi:MAG TPA: ABC-2 transporter permease [Clostridiales bacterium]|nr:ABC-2 transporter permease [Clostridiales bacterium]